MTRPAILPSLALVVVLAACGSDGGDTTIIERTTTVEREPAATEAETATVPSDSGSAEEFTGRCTAAQPPLVPEPGKPGFANVRVLEASCDFAIDVAAQFVTGYGPDCFEGCTKAIEALPCQTQPPIHADVICAAARTEVRFSIEGSD